MAPQSMMLLLIVVPWLPAVSLILALTLEPLLVLILRPVLALVLGVSAMP